MKTAEEYVHLAEVELDHRGHGGDGDRQVARAAVYAALAGIAQGQPLRVTVGPDITHAAPIYHPTQRRDHRDHFADPDQNQPGADDRPEETRP
jgi:hypothetical protein